MKIKILFTPILLAFFALSSCDRPQCTNNNSVFDQHQPSSKIYKKELADRILETDRSTLEYWLQKYEKREGQEYLYFYVQNDDLCAILMLTMQDWEGLEDVRDKEGVSYRNAQFTALDYQIVELEGQTAFIYTSFGRIKD